MNLFFLVEGMVAEAQLYRRWLAYLVPKLQEVDSPDDVEAQHYYMLSGGGYPQIKQRLAQAIEEINEVGRFDYLVLCLDTEESSIQARTTEITEYVQELATSPHQSLPSGTQFKLIVQHRCIETWLLGNHTLYPLVPRSDALQSFIHHWNCAMQDPELIPAHPKFTSHARFHKEYYRLLCAEKRKRCRKGDVSLAYDSAYLQALQTRVQQNSTHLRSFQSFLTFCNQLILSQGGHYDR